MGIPGLYDAIGQGKEVSLAKLAEQISQRRGRPFRLAIDISIWSVQNQAAGKGGKNPALRTLFFRLCRLLRLPIHPLFVFDGTNKPPFKRGRATTFDMPSHIKDGLVRLLELFRFPYIQAPGEAEAECALLQREGIVDAVLSEDVDTLAFGCTCFMRERKEQGDKKYSNVSIYTSKAIKGGKSGLDRDGMVLFALMSGGDYSNGIPRCGPKVALEAARAGFGRELLSLRETDKQGLTEWKERLQYELVGNESGFFETRHPGITIPEWFPNRTVLDYYTTPVVSPLHILKAPIDEWDRRIDVPKLQEATASLFRWSMTRFVKVFSAVLLSYRLRTEGPISLDGVATTTDNPLVRDVLGRRGDSEPDAITELRLEFLPLDVVGLELKEEQAKMGFEMQLDSDEDDEYANNSEVPSSVPSSPKKRKARPTYDPKLLQREWLLEICVQPGINDMVAAWEKKSTAPKPRAKKTVTDRNMKHGAILGYFSASKAGLQKDAESSLHGGRPKNSAVPTVSKPSGLAPHASRITKPIVKRHQLREDSEQGSGACAISRTSQGDKQTRFSASHGSHADNPISISDSPPVTMKNASSSRPPAVLDKPSSFHRPPNNSKTNKSNTKIMEKATSLPANSGRSLRSEQSLTAKQVPVTPVTKPSARPINAPYEAIKGASTVELSPASSVSTLPSPATVIKSVLQQPSTISPGFSGASPSTVVSRTLAKQHITSSSPASTTSLPSPSILITNLLQVRKSTTTSTDTPSGKQRSHVRNNDLASLKAKER